MTPEQKLIFNYLRDQSTTPDLYDAWLRYNNQWFDGKLQVIPLHVSLSKYGNAVGFCSPCIIAIQPYYYQANNWHVTLVHEMAHQMDHQLGLEYHKSGRINNIHNSETWVNRINKLMRLMNDKRHAPLYRRNKKGDYVIDEEIPDGLEVLSLDDVTRWHPKGDFSAQ